jgi:hypothetical protein
MDLFGFINSLNLSWEGFADLVFAGVSFLALVISLIFLFHWKRYGMGGFFLAVMEIVYLVVAIILLTTAFIAL